MQIIPRRRKSAPPGNRAASDGPSETGPSTRRKRRSAGERLPPRGRTDLQASAALAGNLGISVQHGTQPGQQLRLQMFFFQGEMKIGDEVVPPIARVETLALHFDCQHAAFAGQGTHGVGKLDFTAVPWGTERM